MFTYATLKLLYAHHGEQLVMFDADGDGPYSANPADYFNRADGDTFAGTLALREPERFIPLTLTTEET